MKNNSISLHIFIVISACLVSCTLNNKRTFKKNEDVLIVSRKLDSDSNIFVNEIKTALDKGWFMHRVECSELKGKEGIYIIVLNPSIRLKHPKSISVAHINLYFRPKGLSTRCHQIEIEGSIYHSHLGSIEGYDVYGGSVGVDMNKKIKGVLEIQD